MSSAANAGCAAARPLLRRLLGAAALASIGGCAAAPDPSTAAPAPGTLPYRIYDSAGRPVAGTAALADVLRGVQVVFVGEQHDDAAAHRFEHDLLRALAGGERPVTVGLEMFERDVQTTLDAYLSGSVDEAEFLQTSRPWANYAADYRPLVELARSRGWPVVATNVPRSLAATVAQRGLDAVEALSPPQRSLAARDIQCPDDAYYRRFAQEMLQHAGAHGPHGSTDAAEAEPMIRRLYQAQCLKDETMAESVAEAQSGDRLVVHFNGAFHSDFGHGIVSRLQRRRPELRIAVVSLIPVADVHDRTAVADHADRADYVVLTRRAEEAPAGSRVRISGR